ncbi:uncharacterized protein LOC128551208 [Mercenaria mercenaria]|uniref:uncharacterized protein LOC128551208 n=1 Tax=Mercenaria mercenaria TaxID=6596 RepID=UPI00234FA616|nr:uncharacterized protein LOC128551208 [Mercenaria mercenaria]
MSKRKRTPNESPSIEELTERLVPQVTTAVMKSLHDLGVLPRQQPVPVAASSQTSSTLDHTTGVSVPHPAITSTSTTGSFEASNGPGSSTFVDVHVTAPPEPANQSIQNIQGSCIIPASSSSQSDPSATHTQELQLDQSTRQITIGAFSSLDATGSNTNLPSFNNPGIALSVGVDTKLKAKIWAEQFLPFASLISAKESGSLTFRQNPDGSIGLQKAEQEDIKSMEGWHKAFTIFTGIYTERLPHAAPSLMKYSSTIQQLAKQAGPYAALQYDISFRKLRETDPNMHPWDYPNAELYNKAMADSLSFRFRSQSNQSFRAKRAPLPCLNYNNNGQCLRRVCRFSHICKLCRGSHSKRYCPKKPLFSQQSGPSPTTGLSSGSSIQKTTQVPSKSVPATITRPPKP